MTAQATTKDDGGDSVLDPKSLTMLESIMGAEKFRRALETFKQDLDLRISAIAEAETAPNDKSAHAHKLVGTAGIMGLRELSEASKRLELAAGKHADLQPYIESLLAAAARARSRIEALSAAA